MRLPLVSVLIPTYNRPIYFKEALDSALAQDYQNVEIVICDDSTNDETYVIAAPLVASFTNIRYYKNSENLGGIRNFQGAFLRARGEYINFLMDDDLFHPKKISRMMYYYLRDQEQKIKLITSYRQPIDGKGNFIPDFLFTRKRYVSPTTIDGIDAGTSIIIDQNWIGEPTTPLFRKTDLQVPFGTFNGHQYHSAVDMASWLTLSAQGSVLYIPDTLSYLRMHEDNIGKNMNMKFYAAHDWFHMVFFAPRRGFLGDPKQIIESAKGCLRYILFIYDAFSNEYDEAKKRTLKFYAQCLIKRINELVKTI